MPEKLAHAHEKPWAFYGATGVTGRMILERALCRGHRPTLIGRDQSKLDTLTGPSSTLIFQTIGLNSLTFQPSQLDVTLKHVPADLASDKQDALSSNRTLVNLGLDVWHRFLVIRDYSRDILYLISSEASTTTPFARDRSGLALQRSSLGLTVRAFAPAFPVAGDHWKVGDLITRVNDSPAAATTDWRYQANGTRISVEGVGANGMRFYRTPILRDYY
jgi:S1-C subfamily serine protease